MKNKKRKQKSFKGFVKKALISFIIIYIGVLLISQQFDIVRLNKELNGVSEQISASERTSKELVAEAEASVTDEYAERVAREKLGYMKPYEKVFIDSSK